MNVLLITLDTTRPDRMSCYGGQPGLTPTIDAFADDGVRFERAISTAGITPMSHSSILTGLNNYAHGMRVFYSPEVSHRLKDVVDTLPEVLQPLGYRTAARVSSYPVSAAYGLDQGFADFESGVNLDELDLQRQQRHSTSWDTGGRTKTQRRGDLTTASALTWLDQNGTDGPWCMWVHMFDVHDYSLVPPDDFMERFGLPDYPVPGQRLGVDARIDWRERIYDPELAFMDAQIARLRAWLEEHGQARQHGGRDHRGSRTGTPGRARPPRVDEAPAPLRLVRAGASDRPRPRLHPGTGRRGGAGEDDRRPPHHRRGPRGSPQEPRRGHLTHAAHAW